MGLTIHYSLKISSTAKDKARRMVRELRERLAALPFEHVSELMEFEGQECEPTAAQPEGVRWLLIQSAGTVRVPVQHGRSLLYDVTPEEVIAFGAMPGEGSEPAHFGLRRLPRTIETEYGRKRVPNGGVWSWESFCKTHYAADYGDEHFVRCHALVCRALDIAKEIGFEVDVHDEGEFWETRDPHKLLASLGEFRKVSEAILGMLEKIGIEPEGAAVEEREILKGRAVIERMLGEKTDNTN